MRTKGLNFNKSRKRILFFAVTVLVFGIIVSQIENLRSVTGETLSGVQLIEEAVGAAQLISDLSDSGQLPKKMIDTLGEYKVVMVGEIHYVEEHQVFMGALLESLHHKGVRYYLQEIGPATGHMIDLYIRGQISELMPEQVKMDERLIQALASFNSNLRENGRPQEQIRYVGFDMNHWGTEYRWALSQLGILYEHEGLNNYASTLQGINNVSPEYLKEIEAFMSKLTEKAEYADLSVEVRASLLALSETELTSAKVRGHWDDVAREDFIYSQVRRAIDTASENEKLVVNCGMWHAQLTYLWKFGNRDFKWLGMRLREDFENDPKGLYSFSTSAYKGIRKRKFYDSSRNTFELFDRSSRALLPALRAFHGDVPVFIDFKALPPSKDAIVINYPDEQTRVPLNTHFNGLLVYPEISVAKGSVYFETLK